ncbi:MAG TPA: hypothetical protein VEO95_06340 [Chthoniobacteraceae bacterium]|nr:hypothetical protein [Chthoniobacteraceae bacterium]
MLRALLLRDLHGLVRALASGAFGRGAPLLIGFERSLALRDAALVGLPLRELVGVGRDGRFFLRELLLFRVDRRLLIGEALAFEIVLGGFRIGLALRGALLEVAQFGDASFVFSALRCIPIASGKYDSDQRQQEEVDFHKL